MTPKSNYRAKQSQLAGRDLPGGLRTGPAVAGRRGRLRQARRPGPGVPVPTSSLTATNTTGRSRPSCSTSTPEPHRRRAYGPISLSTSAAPVWPSGRWRSAAQVGEPRSPAVELQVDPELESVEVIVHGRQVAVALKQCPEWTRLSETNLRTGPTSVRQRPDSLRQDNRTTGDAGAYRKRESST